MFEVEDGDEVSPGGGLLCPEGIEELDTVATGMVDGAVFDNPDDAYVVGVLGPVVEAELDAGCSTTTVATGSDGSGMTVMVSGVVPVYGTVVVEYGTVMLVDPDVSGSRTR